MERKDFEKKIDELASIEEHKEFAKIVAQMYGIISDYVLSRFEDHEEGWEKVIVSMVKKDGGPKEEEV